MDFHIVFAQYFVFRLYDSALATIILKAT